MKEFDELVKVVEILRKKCPWDKKQTHKTLKPYMIEETYEAIDAIDQGDSEKLCGELGDQLLHIVMHAEMGREKKKFTIEDVARIIKEKMIRRHPHVFGESKAKKLEEIWAKWEDIKKGEQKGKEEHFFSSVPKNLPALAKADKIQKKASRVGFDWDKVAGAWEKVYEEIAEIEEAMNNKKKNSSHVREEIGDLLFAVVNVSRKLGFDAEELLNESTAKFVKRFLLLEKESKKKKLKINEMSNEELDQMWERAKKEKR